ncbi:MAG: hypothetical protein HYX43_17500 [Burkholderiales bacterium]|nr:hypothetical protein [Burkholderiales bacterium]
MSGVGWIFLVFPVLFLLCAWALIKLFAVFNSEDGERYRKMRMQGPFIPLSAEDIEEDERRHKRLG